MDTAIAILRRQFEVLDRQHKALCEQYESAHNDYWCQWCLSQIEILNQQGFEVLAAIEILENHQQSMEVS